MVRFGLYNEVPKKLRRGSSETACCFRCLSLKCSQWRIWIWCHSFKMGFDWWIFIHDFWWSNFGKLMKYHADHLQSRLRSLEGKAPMHPCRMTLDGDVSLVSLMFWTRNQMCLNWKCGKSCGHRFHTPWLSNKEKNRLKLWIWKFLKLTRVELHLLRRSILLSTLVLQ